MKNAARHKVLRHFIDDSFQNITAFSQDLLLQSIIFIKKILEL